MPWTKKNAKYGKRKKRILEIKHRKYISYPEARKLVENSVVTTTYTNVVKPTNNSTQNKGMTHYEMINLKKRTENTNRII